MVPVEKSVMQQLTMKKEEACNCGNCGCLEQYASATGIVRVAQRTLAATDEQTVLRKFTKLSAKNVLDAFKEGDKVACDVHGTGRRNAWRNTCHVCCCVTDPKTIVIGGGVSKAGQPLIDCIQKYYSMLLQHAKKTPIILATSRKMMQVSYGSARMVIKEAIIS